MQRTASMSRVLVAYACYIGRARAIADELAERLRARGHEVEVANARAGRLPPPQDYDAVILGSQVEHRHPCREIRDYARTYGHELDQMPTGFFSVSLAASVPFANPDPGRHVAQFVADVGWVPDHAASFGSFGTPQAWKLADLVTVSLAEHPGSELSASYGPI
jgi:menaquinone-dependent protoporphyrinogen oxidase